MLLSYDKLKQRPRIFRKLTGMNLEEFTRLLERLRTALDKEFSPLGRQRKLATHTDRVLLLLIYYRCYCTHEFLGYFVGLDDSNVCRLFQRLEPLIAKKIHIKKDRTLNEEKIAKLLTDVTEQPIQRPKNKKDRKLYYSGKKKRHTQKLEITITPEGKIMNLSHSEPGRVHDRRIRQRGGPLPMKAEKYFDLGYQGIQHEMTAVVLPHKKPKGGKLTPDQKEYNRQHSKVRIVVEHKFAQMKQFRILANIYRNFRKKHHLRANIIAGILNFQAGF
jgi:hypothetical protein